MTKASTMRLSLYALIAIGSFTPAFHLHAQANKHQKLALQKNCLSTSELIALTKKTPQLRLLPACPPAPSIPGSTLPTQNPAATSVTFFPNNSVSNSAVVPPQTVGTQFIAGSLATFPSYLGAVPSTMGVAGPTQYVMGINGGLVSFDKSGNKDGILDTENSSFLDLDGDFSFFADFSNGHLRYDTFTDRYYYTILNFDSAGRRFPSGLSIAVSDSGVLTTGTRWTVVNIFNNSIIPDNFGCGGDENQFFDFGGMAIDENALYVSFNLYFEDGLLFTSNTLFVIQKQSLLLDGPAFVTAFHDVTGFPGDEAPARSASSTLVPVDNFDSNPQFGYFVGQDPSEFGKLIFFRISNSGTQSPTLAGPFSLDVPTTGSNLLLHVPFQGNLFGAIGQLGGIDDRPYEAHIRNNQLYTVQTIPVTSAGVGSPTGDRYGQRWYQIDMTGGVPSLVQAGTLWDQSPNNTLHYIYGAIMTNAQGQLVISGTVAGPTVAPSAFYVGRLASDAPGTLRVGAVVNDIIYAQGQGTFSQYLNSAQGGGQRWGDYSYISLDPEDELSMWTIQQITFNGLYRLAVAKLLAP